MPMNVSQHGDTQNQATDASSTFSQSQRGLEEALHPLRTVAERVGREVELFAEKLDQWRSSEFETQKEKRIAALELISEYKTIAEDTVKRLRAEHGKAQQRQVRTEFRLEHTKFHNNTNKESDFDDDNGELAGRPGSGTTVADLKIWQAEHATWQLVEDTIQYHFPDLEAEANGANYGTVQQGSRFEADGTHWREFLSADVIAREKLTVLHWLEKTAEQSGNDLEIMEEQLELGSGRGKALWTQGWLHTKEKIKGEKRLRMWDVPINSSLPEIRSSDQTKLLVTQLDLDATSRQDRVVEEADAQFERSFWLMCWKLLRYGKGMHEIRDWCSERNLCARALMIGASPHSVHNETVEQRLNSRFRWRRACLYAARFGSLDNHERAVLALISGWFRPVEDVCRNWDDSLFALYNTELVSQYEAYITNRFVDELPQKELYSLGMVVRTTPDQSDTGPYEEISALRIKPDSNTDACSSFKLVQESLIRHDFENFVFRQGIGLARKADSAETDILVAVVPAIAARFLPKDEVITSVTDDANALRTLVHILLVFKELGFDIGSGNRRIVMEGVVVAYIAFLRLAGKLSLIPLYASVLSSDLRILTIARVLPDISDPGERLEYIKLMSGYNLDVFSIIMAQYQFAKDYSDRENTKGSGSHFAPVKLLEEGVREPMWPGKRIMPQKAASLERFDSIMISSLEWYLLAEGNWRRTFWDLTDAMKSFLYSGRIEAAVALVERMPFIEISLALTPPILGKRMDIMDDREGSDVEGLPLPNHFAWGEQMQPAMPAVLRPERTQIHRDILRKHAHAYYQLIQLIDALKALWAWRKVEDYHISKSLNIPTDTPPLSRKPREYLDDLISAVEPLLKDFLMEPSDGLNAEELRQIRNAYLPEVILAYNSALHCAAHLVSRDYLLESLDLATVLADNEILTKCFVDTGRMAELVEAFALTSKAILTLNEANPKSARKKGRDGRTLGIWEVSIDY